MQHKILVSTTKYKPINTDWFYTYLSISNLSAIQEELIVLLKAPTGYIRFTDYYINIYKHSIVGCPELMQYLDKVKLKHKLQRILFSVTNGIDMNSAPPHVDSVTPLTGIKYSLNIPLIEASDSYTVWYEKTSGDELEYDINTKTGWVKDTNIREIARAQYTQPMLLNTSILHCGKANSAKRVICGLRFQPELTDDDISRLLS